MCVFMTNLVPIGQSIAEIWPFIDFSRWRPSAISDFKKSEILSADLLGGPICVTVSIFVPSGPTVA